MKSRIGQKADESGKSKHYRSDYRYNRRRTGRNVDANCTTELQQPIEPEYSRWDMESMKRCIFETMADYGVTAVIDWNRQSKVSRECAGRHDGNAAHKNVFWQVAQPVDSEQLRSCLHTKMRGLDRMGLVSLFVLQWAMRCQQVLQTR